MFAEAVGCSREMTIRRRTTAALDVVLIAVSGVPFEWLFAASNAGRILVGSLGGAMARGSGSRRGHSSRGRHCCLKAPKHVIDGVGYASRRIRGSSREKVGCTFHRVESPSWRGLVDHGFDLRYRAELVVRPLHDRQRADDRWEVVKIPDADRQSDRDDTGNRAIGDGMGDRAAGSERVADEDQRLPRGQPADPRGGGGHVADLPASVVVKAVASFDSAKIESQRGQPAAVQLAIRVEYDRIVERSSV